MDRKFTILGDTHSGKTCYLLAIYAAMAGGFEGYTIRAQDPTVNAKLLDMYLTLEDEELDHPKRFPQASFDVENYSFNLGYANKTILPFDWIDYPGGNLVLRENVDREQYEKVAKNIQESSVLFICVDGEHLAKGNNHRKIRKLAPLSMSINPYFNDYLSNKKLPPIGFIVTKYDLCCDTTTEEDLKQIIFEAFSPFFASRDNTIGIIPVSLGKEIADNDYKGELDPMNVHLPIFMGIYFVLCDQIKTNENYQRLIDANLRDSANLRDDNSRRQSELLSLKNRISTLRTQKYKEEDHFFGFMIDKEKVQALKNQIYAAEQDVERLESAIRRDERKIQSNESENERTKKLIQNLVAKDEMFTDYLNDIMWFFDGAWQNSFRWGLI